MGGTFMSLPAEYRDYFVRNLHDALSGHSSSNVGEAVRFSEHSRVKCIGLTIETRPDFCQTPHLTQVRRLGAGSASVTLAFSGSQSLHLLEAVLALSSRKSAVWEETAVGSEG